MLIPLAMDTAAVLTKYYIDHYLYNYMNFMDSKIMILHIIIIKKIPFEHNITIQDQYNMCMLLHSQALK